MERKTEDFSQAQLLALLRSPAGQQLVATLQQQHGPILQQAMTLILSGRQEEARKVLAPVMQDPLTQQLLQQMGGSHG